MSRCIWRISTDAPDYTADDLAGAGAKATGGRWNHVGVPLVYASETRALACLETVVHLKSAGLPFNRYLVQINVPDDVWASARRETATTLPTGWDAEPAGAVSLGFGSVWVAGMKTCLLILPSVIANEECNVLINPAHGDAALLSATKVRRWLYDPRLGS